MTLLSKHRTFKKEKMLTWYSETAELGTQCVAWAKQYSQVVLGQTLKGFSWSAIQGWNTWSPFAGLPFQKIINSATFVPKVGDIMFWQIGQYGHVCIADEFCTARVAFVLEQNGGNWDGVGKDDRWNVNAYDYITPKFLWVARLS